MRYEIEALAACLVGNDRAPSDLLRITDRANEYLVTPQLCVAMQQFFARDDLERDIVGYWQAAYDANQFRNRRLGHQLSAVLRILDQRGLRPLLLTGAAALATARDGFASARMVADLDLMLAPAQAEMGVRALTENGYACFAGRGRYTAAKLVHSRQMALVHVHANLPGVGRDMSFDDILVDAQRITFRSREALLPSATRQAMYLIGHDLLQERGLLLGKLHLRHLLDLRESSISGRIDWDRIRAACSSLTSRTEVALYRRNLSRLLHAAGSPPSRAELLYTPLYHRQMLRAEGKRYAILEDLFIIKPFRRLWSVARGTKLVRPADISRPVAGRADTIDSARSGQRDASISTRQCCSGNE